MMTSTSRGLITIKDIEKQIKYPLSAKDEQGRLLCGAGVGITGNMMERVEALVNAHVDVIVMDSAHGHSKNIIEAVKKVKATYPDLQVIAGNIATGDAARALIEAGADAVKVGIGPESYLYDPYCCRNWCSTDHCDHGLLCRCQRISVSRLSLMVVSSIPGISQRHLLPVVTYV